MLGGGADDDKYYCGRKIGRAIMVGSDGRCGPVSGPQCNECLAYQANVSRQQVQQDHARRGQEDLQQGNRHSQSPSPATATHPASRLVCALQQS